MLGLCPVLTEMKIGLSRMMFILWMNEIFDYLKTFHSFYWKKTVSPLIKISQSFTKHWN